MDEVQEIINRVADAMKENFPTPQCHIMTREEYIEFMLSLPLKPPTDIEEGEEDDNT